MARRSAAKRGKLIVLAVERARRAPQKGRTSPPTLDARVAAVHRAIADLNRAAMPPDAAAWLAQHPEVDLACSHLQWLGTVVPLLARRDLPDEHRAALAADLGRATRDTATAKIECVFGAIDYAAAQLVELPAAERSSPEPSPGSLRVLVDRFAVQLLLAYLPIADVQVIDRRALGETIRRWHDDRPARRRHGKYATLARALAGVQFSGRKGIAASSIEAAHRKYEAARAGKC